jgi:hypothetical protein
LRLALIARPRPAASAAQVGEDVGVRLEATTTEWLSGAQHELRRHRVDQHAFVGAARCGATVIIWDEPDD